jgi:hypothetical protein
MQTLIADLRKDLYPSAKIEFCPAWACYFEHDNQRCTDEGGDDSQEAAHVADLSFNDPMTTAPILAYDARRRAVGGPSSPTGRD